MQIVVECTLVFLALHSILAQITDFLKRLASQIFLFNNNRMN